MAPIFRWGFMGLILTLIYIPILVLVVNSFNASKYGIKWGGFTFKWYEKFWNNDGLMTAALNSLTVSIVAATVATIIGTLAAVALHRYQFKGKALLSSMVFVSMLTPEIVMAISLLIVFMALGIKLGFVSLVIGHITFCLPFVIVAVYSRLKGFDMKMLEAARDLGASESRIFWKIILPLALPAVAAGWLLSFTLSLDDVIVSAFVTGPGYEILPLKVYSMVRVGVSPEVNAISTILLVVSLVLVIVSQLLLREDK
ncbi:MAG TPA: spermidine/putrescine ABC transporter permease PotC [Cellvibrio sp.]|jgi:spermidine/putrescine transport system permease protein|uniref:Spermidine/putrescine transport system permease protein PotC n=1 Tax=Cellvibrio mixtus TaxID=39650 RepID=A0A266QCW4_9GAMM|nr:MULTISPECIES: spermidine/putrescine ABC transporter permease PotC [Cellvibrio]AQT61484.1 spermidine/putrescine ABC transporter permease PotC [Cellvibrio sp. PSBB023]OZY87728.1 spermidine/putrescine ABC transporter permease PotC [Cellvibrio mixtus]